LLDGRVALVVTCATALGTTAGETGDPVATATDYAFCVYPNGQPSVTRYIGGATVCRGGPCWRSDGKGRLKYDTTHVDLQVKVAADGQTSVAVSEKGSGAALPALPLALPVVVQLQSGTGG
jgi:hypothetical protein